MSNLLPGAQEGRTECEPELPGEGKNLWRDLKRDVKQQREPILDLWQNLRDQMNLAKKKPKQLDTIKVAFQEGSRGESNYVLGNPGAATYLKLDLRDFFLWELMDGEHSEALLGAWIGRCRASKGRRPWKGVSCVEAST